jgi:adenylate cyclase
MNASTTYRIGQVFLDRKTGQLVDAGNKAIALRAQSMQVLEVLVESAGSVVTRETLHERVWPHVVVTDDSLTQCIGEIRRVIGDARHETLRTVARRGYALELQPAEGAGPHPQPAWRAWVVAALAGAVLLGAGLDWRMSSESQSSRSYAFGPRPPLAVLAFRSAESGERSGFSAAVAEELLAALARDTDLPVISARSSFSLDPSATSLRDIARLLKVRYLVDGQVRREGESLLLQVELIDAQDGRVVWIGYRGVTARNLAQGRSELVEGIASNLGASMRRAEERRALQRPPGNLDVYELTLRGYAGKHTFTPESYRAARADLQRALAIDPQHAPAWACLANLNAFDAFNEITGEWRRTQLGEVRVQALRAVELDPELPYAYQVLTLALIYMGEHAQALEAASAAFRLAPHDPDNQTLLARALAEVGQAREATEKMDQALPYYPLVPNYITATDAHIRWAAGDLDRAVERANECNVQAPRLVLCHVHKIVALVELGRTAEARQDLLSLQGITPVSSEIFMRSMGGTPEYRARKRAALDALGVP